MGQKVHPIGMRLGIVKDWSSRWYAPSKDFADTLCADIKVREYLREKLAQAGISRIQIDRPARNAKITVYTARPGVIIGKSGKEIELLRDEINKILGVPVHISIEEVRKPELDAKLVADSIAQQLEKRVMFRRAMKRAVTTAMRLGAKGIKICISGRLGGAEIARSEWYREGRVPLHTLRADIDYGLGEAFTTYGVIGVKVWIFKGEILDKEQAESATATATTDKTSAKQEK
jgi:small subunit ribosomal protein S3